VEDEVDYIIMTLDNDCMKLKFKEEMIRRARAVVIEARSLYRIIIEKLIRIAGTLEYNEICYN
jgi:hypothetical protein